MFENPRRGRQARNFTTNVQIVFRTDTFQKLTFVCSDVVKAGKVDPGDRVTLPVEIVLVNLGYL